jgi:hypothetical protein
MNNKYDKAIKQLLKEYNINVAMWRRPSKLIGGLSYLEIRTIRSPYPKSNKSFEIFAHEVGHIAQGKIRPVCLSEYKAEMFAREQFRRFGFKMSKLDIARQTWQICARLATALNHGLKTIPSELIDYEKLLLKFQYNKNNATKTYYVADYNLLNV